VSHDNRFSEYFYVWFADPVLVETNVDSDDEEEEEEELDNLDVS
jgi:hypothetical protein